MTKTISKTTTLLVVAVIVALVVGQAAAGECDDLCNGCNECSCPDPSKCLPDDCCPKDCCGCFTGLSNFFDDNPPSSSGSSQTTESFCCGLMYTTNEVEHTTNDVEDDSSCWDFLFPADEEELLEDEEQGHHRKHPHHYGKKKKKSPQFVLAKIVRNICKNNPKTDNQQPPRPAAPAAMKPLPHARPEFVGHAHGTNHHGTGVPFRMQPPVTQAMTGQPSSSTGAVRRRKRKVNKRRACCLMTVFALLTTAIATPVAMTLNPNKGIKDGFAMSCQKLQLNNDIIMNTRFVEFYGQPSADGREIVFSDETGRMLQKYTSDDTKTKVQALRANGDEAGDLGEIPMGREFTDYPVKYDFTLNKLPHQIKLTDEMNAGIAAGGLSISAIGDVLKKGMAKFKRYSLYDHSGSLARNVQIGTILMLKDPSKDPKIKVCALMTSELDANKDEDQKRQTVAFALTHGLRLRKKGADVTPAPSPKTSKKVSNKSKVD